jgi:uncharacterized protein YjiS (DUF1127 family)
MAGFTLRTIASRPDAAPPLRPSPAVRPAALRVAEEPAQPGRLPPGRLARWAAHVIAWYQGFADRRLLASLDDRLLRDLGIDRSAVGGDSTGSYWRLREPVESRRARRHRGKDHGA